MKDRLNESAITDLIARITPWLAPLPNAYLVYRTSIDTLGWPWLIAFAAGLVIEALGLSAVHTALEFRSHNRGLKDEDKRQAPYSLAIVLVAVYLFSVTVLTVILDTAPELARYAPLIFPIISLCGVTIIGIRTDHRRLVADMTLSLAPPYNKKRHRLERSRLLAEAEIEPKRGPTKKQLQEIEMAERKEYAEVYAQNRRAPTPMGRQVMIRDGWTCYYCGADMKGWPQGDIHIDHFYPLNGNGSDDPHNLVVSCKTCNLSKSSKIPSSEEIQKFKLYLLNCAELSKKEKVWALNYLDLLPKQKDIAAALGTSPSYISASLADLPDELSEEIVTLCASLELVGKPEVAQDEPGS